VDGVL
jgi:hypothetical protein